MEFKDQFDQVGLLQLLHIAVWDSADAFSNKADRFLTCYGFLQGFDEQVEKDDDYGMRMAVLENTEHDTVDDFYEIVGFEVNSPLS